ncbi:MAG: hypothetical protein QM703_15580 [Gemmatales bacterium]
MYAAILLTLLAFPADLVSGPQVGKKIYPYTALIATGPNRGTSHCYVCETEDDPAVIILARASSEPLGQLVKQVDQLLLKHQKEKLHGWVTFVGMKQPAQEPEIVSWGKKHGLKTMSLGIYEPTEGPPGYKLNTEAEITILLVKQSKVVHNFAFPAKGLTAAETKKILELVPALVK